MINKSKVRNNKYEGNRMDQMYYQIDETREFSF